MTVLATILQVLVILAYLGATGAYIAEFAKLRHFERPVGLYLTGLGFGLHTSFHWARGASGGDLLSAYSIGYSVINYAWVMVLAFLLMHLKWKVDTLGALVLPIPLVLLVFGFTQDPTAPSLVYENRGLVLTLHMFCITLAFAAFSLSFVMAVSYLFVNRALKSKQFAALQSYPPLQTLDKLERLFLNIGFPLVSLGILLGAALWFQNWSEFDRSRLISKELLALFTWAVYASIWSGRRYFGVSARKGAVYTVAGFLCMLLTLLGTHRFGG